MSCIRENPDFLYILIEKNVSDCTILSWRVYVNFKIIQVNHAQFYMNGNSEYETS